ncbi:MAG: hypothetical protein WC833_09635 [Bacteroidales bacterium]|jgi:hypothetical protein
MKNFFKKKSYFFTLLVSFATLFSAVLYAEDMRCGEDNDCPPGMFCLLPDGICIQGEPSISCTQHIEYGTLLICYKLDFTYYPPCVWTGVQVNNCAYFYF